MGYGAAYAYLAMSQALADAGLGVADITSERTGIIAGSGGASVSNYVQAADNLRTKGVRQMAHS